VTKRKTKTKTAAPVCKQFDTLADFLTATRAEPHDSWTHGATRSSRRTPSEFCGNVDFDGAHQLAASGWPDGLAKMQTSLALVQTGSNGTMPAWMPSIAGARPDVGRYLAGAPDCMLRRQQTASSRRPCLTVTINASFSGCVESAHIMNYGAAICGAIDELESAGYSVALAVGAITRHSESRSETGALVTLKAHGDPLDIDRAAYCIAHPSFLRTLFFAYWEAVTDYNDLGSGYGRTAEMPDAMRGDLYFPSANSLSECSTPAGAADHVRGIIAAQMPDLLREAA